jgi:hypothetical protein
LKSQVVIICFSLFLIISTIPFVQNVNALNIIISHGGTGEIELCIESDGYEDQCDDFDLSEWANPLPYELDVEDPDEGHDFQVCYEVKDADEKMCKDFEFTGSEDQSVDILIPDINSLPADNEPVNNDDDFSLQNANRNLNSPSNTPARGLPAVPTSPP